MILFLFLDGVGLGVDDASVNPFVAAKTPFLESLLGGKLMKKLEPFVSNEIVFRPLDAKLGFTGLPQSATGQTTLLTGKNGADIMQGHYGPYPGPTLKKELDKGTLFSNITGLGKRATLTNLYPPGYFQAIETKQQKYNVPVYAAKQAGLELLKVNDYREGRAVSVDMTGAYLHKHDVTLPSLSALEMGKRLAGIAGQNDFTFFDLWLTDQAGHRWSFADCVNLVDTLDAFVCGVVENLSDITLVITSDHGNLEDKSVKTHTLADVPLIAVGNQAGAFANAESLLDVAPMIRRVMSNEQEV
jgi:2,3-bisphosphoglycerate-independent phosphoglycerate mutase